MHTAIHTACCLTAAILLPSACGGLPDEAYDEEAWEIGTHEAAIAPEGGQRGGRGRRPRDWEPPAELVVDDSEEPADDDDFDYEDDFNSHNDDLLERTQAEMDALEDDIRPDEVHTTQGPENADGSVDCSANYQCSLAACDSCLMSSYANHAYWTCEDGEECGAASVSANCSTCACDVTTPCS